MISAAIKYVILPEKKTVIAILENTQFDAYNKALKICKDLTTDITVLGIYPNPELLMMPTKFKGIVVCDDSDDFDIDIGKDKAKERCLRKYYKSFDKRINKFIESLDKLSLHIMTASDDGVEE